MGSLTLTQDMKKVSPVFSNFLYKDETGFEYQRFIATKQPAEIAPLLKDPKVLEIFYRYEPGPVFDYENLRKNIAQLEKHMIKTYKGKVILLFYKDLFKVRARYVINGIKFEVFNAYMSILRTYYITSRPERRRTSHPNDPAFLQYEKECDQFVASQASEAMAQQCNELLVAYNKSCTALVEFKTNPNTWHYAGIIWEMVRVYQIKVVEPMELERALAERRKEEKKQAAEKKQLKQDSVAMHPYQLGGVQPPMDDRTSLALMAWMKSKMENIIDPTIAENGGQ